ncbi:MAG: hypothetical protein PHP79_09490 [Clostridia bacterium]|nr:hypothetical protein [Clostridia bacterium]
MEKRRIMKFKLLSYKQALKKAEDRNDKFAVKRWSENIEQLQQEIEQIV